MPSDLVKLQGSPRDLARWQKAQQQVVGERYTPALASYRELVRRFPGVEQLWFELGLAAHGELEFKVAEDAFARAGQLAPADSSLQILLGQQFHRLRCPALARVCFERSVQADQRSVAARLSLAAWYERERRLDDALAAVEAALATNPKSGQALCLKALLLHRKNESPAAEALLREVIKNDSPDTNARISSRHLLGVVLDQLGQYEEALRWLLESKHLLRQTANVAGMEQDYDRADAYRRHLLAAITPETVRSWREQAVAAALPHPLALLGGHPRSGTTLLEQILGAHPGIIAFDESEAFVQEIWHRLAPMQATRGLSLDELNKLDTSQRTRMRQRYFKSLLRETDGETHGRLVLDKNPSPTAALHLWLRVLPETRVVIALRDPRDVVVSCFFQNLMLTPTNANFLSLERTVKHYCDLMDVWLRVRKLGGFDWIESRYEDVVENVEKEGRRVTEFCGLQWHPKQAEHQEIARAKVLFAPTFSDVAQPVHKRAIGRWQHYAAALEPFQQELARYCKEFGY
ncbi:MAG TPA: sulfotransferase [Patescibacteria group bacterium]|nr:sulfotransferase [Patescibacteria group bacterium]